jgi:hypothetical protein
MDLEKVQICSEKIIKFCESLNKHITIDDIYKNIINDDIICIHCNTLKCSIFNDENKCKRKATHIAICRNNTTSVIHLCWFHCLELHGKIDSNNIAN